MGKKLILLALISLFFSSCAILKKEKTTTTKEKEKTEIATDTTSKETVNKKIDDSATIKVAQSETGNRDFDLAVNKAVTSILSSINFQKSSGDNSYRAYYDEKLKALQFQIELGETKNKEIETNKEAVTEKSFEENINEYVKKIVIPWWIYVILIIVFWKQISGIVFFIFPQLRGLKTLKDIVTPPTK